MKTLIFLLGTLLLFSTSTAESPSGTPFKKDATLIMRENMISISRQLGVTCAYCHDVKNFKSGKMKAYKVGLKHIQVTKYINGKNGFNGRPKITCYTCHRGVAKPDYKEKEL